MLGGLLVAAMVAAGALFLFYPFLFEVRGRWAMRRDDKRSREKARYWEAEFRRRDEAALLLDAWQPPEGSALYDALQAQMGGGEN